MILDDPQVREFGDDGVAFQVETMSALSWGTQYESSVPVRLLAYGRERADRFSAACVLGARVAYEGFFEHVFFDREDGSRGSRLQARLVSLHLLATVDDLTDRLSLSGTGVVTRDPYIRLTSSESSPMKIMKSTSKAK